VSVGWRTRNAQDLEFVSLPHRLILARLRKTLPSPWSCLEPSRLAVVPPTQRFDVTADSLRLAKVDTGRPTDRVYALISRSLATRRFVWIQEADPAGDEARVTKLREILKRPPTLRRGMGGMGAGIPGAAGLMQAMAARGGGGGRAAAAQSAMAMRLASMPTAQRRQMIAVMSAAGQLPPGLAEALGEDAGPSTSAPGGAGRGTGAFSSTPGIMPGAPPATPGVMPGAPAPTPAPAPAPAGSSSSSSSSAASAGTESEVARVGMMDVLRAQAAAAAARTAPLPLIVNPTDALASATRSDESIARLLALLPEGQRTREHLEAAIRSPQFRQGLEGLSAALSSENFTAVFASFGLDPADGQDSMARGDSVGAFLDAIRAKIAREGSTDAPSDASGGADAGGGAGAF